MNKLRGKRLLFVGDSLQRSQWESFVCLVESIIPEGEKSMKRSRKYFVFKAKVRSVIVSCATTQTLLGQIPQYLVLQGKLRFLFSSVFLDFIGIQCDYRVLLGTVYRRIKHGYTCDFGSEEKDSESGLSGRSS